MKNLNLMMAVALATLAVVACEKKESSKSKSQTRIENFSYQFEYNGCDTKKHEFSSLNELCSALQDDGLNEGCARNLREDYFKDNCSGTFTPHYKGMPLVDGAPTGETTETNSIKLPEDMDLVTMKPDELKFVQFLNPIGEEAKTTVYCLSSAETALDLLVQDGTGGVILGSGGSIVLKNIPSSSTDQDNTLKTLTMISCQKE